MTGRAILDRVGCGLIQSFTQSLLGFAGRGCVEDVEKRFHLKYNFQMLAEKVPKVSYVQAKLTTVLKIGCNLSWIHSGMVLKYEC